MSSTSYPSYPVVHTVVHTASSYPFLHQSNFVWTASGMMGQFDAAVLDAKHPVWPPEPPPQPLGGRAIRVRDE